MSSFGAAGFAATHLAEMLAGKSVPRWKTPGDLAQFIDRRTKQTPALKLIDRLLVETFERPNGRLMISMPPQEGKALALDTLIATPSGWSTMGELQPGDRVFGSDGKPCTVTWKSPVWYGHTCYQVKTGDGEVITANAAHEWIVHLARGSGDRIITTTLLAKPRSKNAQIISAEILDLPDADLPLDPYVLGVWLGDGSSESAAITVPIWDRQIIDRIETAGYPAVKSTSPHGWSLADQPTRLPGQGHCSRFRRVLVSLNVWGNEHVPDAYLRGSAAQRLALLQGLIDTGGYVSPKGQVEFTSITQQLAESVRNLVFSLGGKATIQGARASIDGRDCGPYYRVKFYLKDAASLDRKAASCKNSRDASVRYTWADPCDTVPTVCIEVDSKDHTYLAGRTLLPTHNSQRVAEAFPLWCLTQNKDLRIAIVSYSDNLARRSSRNIRGHIITYSADLGLVMRQDLHAQSEWQLQDHRGGVYATSIGGQLVGQPVDMLIIDDPHKGAKEAASELLRNEVWEWWQGTALSRLAPGAPVVLIQTRWHEEDLAGKLVEDDPDGWVILNIPAKADHNPAKGEIDPLGRDPGEYMMSARDTVTARRDFPTTERSVGPRMWNAEYQGRPSPTEGSILKRSYWGQYDTRLWVEYDGVRTVPDGTLVMSWDMAFKNSNDSDYVVGQVWLHRGPNAYLVDQIRGRYSFSESVHQVEVLCARWPQCATKLIEDKANGTAIIDTLQSKIPGIIPVTPHESKEARAEAVSVYAEAGNVKLPNPLIHAWVEALVEECAAFPNGRHDDQVDTLTQALARIFINAGQGSAWLGFMRQNDTTRSEA